MTDQQESRERILELLDRNLQGIFGENDEAVRRANVEELYAEDAELYVPPGIIRGRDAIATFAGDLRATHPHFGYTPIGEPQVLHDVARLAWGSGPKGGAFEYTGWDVIVVRNGLIQTLYVFLDPPAG
jgi:hypothetical protein